MYDDKAKIRDELIMTLTAELPVMRARLGMSQEVMASAIGVSRQTYSAIEVSKVIYQFYQYSMLLKTVCTIHP